LYLKYRFQFNNYPSRDDTRYEAFSKPGPYRKWQSGIMGGSRKYPYPYHGWHLGIPEGRGGYVDWNSEDMGGLRRLEFRGHGEGSLDWNSESIREFSGE